MKHSPDLSLIDDNSLRAALMKWATLPQEHREAWFARAVAPAFLAVVSPVLAQQGVARVRLLGEPASLPVRELQLLLRDLSEQIGYLVPQTFANNRIALIQDRGKSYQSHRTRGHETNAELAYHSDRSDLNLLLYVRCASNGGQIGVIGFEEAARELERRNPAAFALLLEGYPIDLREERIFPDPEWYVRPLLWQSPAGLRGHYIRRFINDSQRHPACPRLSPAQTAALDAFDEVLREFSPDRQFSPVPGELLILDNYRVMHARTSYEDTGRGSSRRLAIRAWVAPYDSEPLPDFMLPIAGALEPGVFRGGLGQGQRYHRLLGRSHRTVQQQKAIHQRAMQKEFVS
jgi:hypothetical protein